MTADLAGAWFRVSTGGQDEASQEPDVFGWITDHEYIHAKTYRLHGKSASKGQQDKMVREVIADMRDGVITVLVVWLSDRIERRGAYNAFDLARRVREAGGRIEYVKEPYLNEVNEMSDVMLALVSTRARMEVKVKRDRALMARQTLAVDDKWPGGRPAFGKRALCVCHHLESCPAAKDCQGWKLDVHDANAALLSDVAAKVVAGKSVNAVTADLNTAEIPSADGKAWSSHTLRKILRNPETADVIGPGVWTDVIARIGPGATPGNRGTRTATDSTLLDLIWCGDCADAGREKGKLYRWHRARTGTYHARCRNDIKRAEVREPCYFPMVPYLWLEGEAFRVMMRATHNGEDRCQVLVTNGAAGMKAIRRDEIAAELVKLAAERRTMTRSDFTARQDKLLDEQDELDAQETDASGPAWQDAGESVAERWERLSAADRRLWLLRAGVRFTVRQTHLEPPFGRWMLTYSVPDAGELRERIVSVPAAMAA